MYLEIVAEYGRNDLAKVYVARMGGTGRLVEFVESLQPPHPKEKKWVVIVSSMLGCPVGCIMCDAGGSFNGLLTPDDIVQQVHYAIKKSWPDGNVKTEKFKIQFARMGEPTMNPAVLNAMEQLAEAYPGNMLNVSLSTIAPSAMKSKTFLKKLTILKDKYFGEGRFQLQFSIHTTDEALRNQLIPVKKWTFFEIAEFGRSFRNEDAGDRKITLNFALSAGYPVDPAVLRHNFKPDDFLIKLTPLNPTIRAQEGGLKTAIDPHSPSSAEGIIEALKKEGFDVLLSIGEPEENLIGSNCGQYIQRALSTGILPVDSYDSVRSSKNFLK